MNNNILRQAQQLQAKLVKAQQELADLTTEVTTGGGAVKIVIDGKQNIRSVTISPDVVSAGDVEMLQDLVMTAFNEAIAKSQEIASEKLGKLTGGLNIPGLGM
jgi:DNA-binding YbaB/EbfC family protein